MANFSHIESSDDSFTLLADSPIHVSTTPISLAGTATVAVFTAAQYAGVQFWAVDSSHPQLPTTGQSIQGYQLDPSGYSGLSYVTLPAGNWYIAAYDPTLSGAEAVAGFTELSLTSLPGGQFGGNVPMVANGNSGTWEAIPFTITGNPQTYIETEGSGGQFMIMNNSQLQQFETAFPKIYTGGAYSAAYALGGPEFEGQLPLSAGSWNLVWINNTKGWAGGAANISAFSVSSTTGSVQGPGTSSPTATPTPSTTPASQDLGIAALDMTTGRAAIPPDPQPYSGPVLGLQEEYINITSDNLNVTASTDNWFIHTGGGEDAIKAYGGTNVLDGGTGSNFLTGGSGTDTFFVDDRAASADIWSTVVGFHTGDAATIWGVTPQDFSLNWVDNQGAAGYTGLTLHATAPGKPTASLTLAGYNASALGNGILSVQFGTVSGNTYMYIYANG